MMVVTPRLARSRAVATCKGLASLIIKRVDVCVFVTHRPGGPGVCVCSCALRVWTCGVCDVCVWCVCELCVCACVRAYVGELCTHTHVGRDPLHHRHVRHTTKAELRKELYGWSGRELLV